MRARAGHRGMVAGASLALLGLSAVAGWTATSRIGFIDSSKIFQEYKVAQEAQLQFDRQVQNWRTEAAEKEKMVTQLRAELRDQGPILSTLKRQEREEAVQKAVQEYETFVQDVWGPQGRAAQENERTTREIVEQIRLVVEKLASDKGLEIVFDAASGAIIYADRSLDLSAEVVRELNARTETGAR
jgi:outer membrane protein